MKITLYDKFEKEHIVTYDNVNAVLYNTIYFDDGDEIEIGKDEYAVYDES